jgi:fructokinase
MTSALQIIGIGEVLWDLLPAGKQLGGAPANFVCHAQALSASALLISRVGDDPTGRDIIVDWQARGLRTDTISVDGAAPTGTVSVEVDQDGQPHYTIHENVAWDRLEADPPALAVVRAADAVCFGTLAQRGLISRRAINTLLAATRPEALRIFDINLRAPYLDDDVIKGSMATANVLKLNDQELPVLARLFELTGEPRRQIAALAERFALRSVALTHGGNGSLLFASGAFAEHAGLPVTVQDTVGAGDSFTAALAIGLLRGWPPEKINEHANAVAAYVCSQSGATPVLPELLRAPFISG